MYTFNEWEKKNTTLYNLLANVTQFKKQTTKQCKMKNQQLSDCILYFPA